MKLDLATYIREVDGSQAAFVRRANELDLDDDVPLIDQSLVSRLTRGRGCGAAQLVRIVRAIKAKPLRGKTLTWEDLALAANRSAA